MNNIPEKGVIGCQASPAGPTPDQGEEDQVDKSRPENICSTKKVPKKICQKLHWLPFGEAGTKIGDAVAIHRVGKLVHASICCQ